MRQNINFILSQEIRNIIILIFIFISLRPPFFNLIELQNLQTVPDYCSCQSVALKQNSGAICSASLGDSGRKAGCYQGLYTSLSNSGLPNYWRMSGDWAGISGSRKLRAMSGNDKYFTVLGRIFWQWILLGIASGKEEREAWLKIDNNKEVVWFWWFYIISASLKQ